MAPRELEDSGQAGGFFTVAGDKNQFWMGTGEAGEGGGAVHGWGRGPEQKSCCH